MPRPAQQVEANSCHSGKHSHCNKRLKLNFQGENINITDTEGNMTNLEPKIKTNATETGVSWQNSVNQATTRVKI